MLFYFIQKYSDTNFTLFSKKIFAKIQLVIKAVNGKQ